MRAIWLTASAILLLPPSALAESPVDGLNDYPSNRLVFALDPFAEPIGYSILKGDAKEKVLRRFGEPIEQEVSTVPARFPEETYTSYDLRYKDVSFKVGKWTDREHSWIESVEIVGKDGSTVDVPGAVYRIAFEFDSDDRVSKVSISFSED